DAAEVVPVGVANDDVGDFFGLDACELHRFVGPNVFRGWKRPEKSIAVIAAVKKDVVAAASNEPDDHGDVDFLAFRRAHDEARNFILDRKSTRLNSSHSQISYAVFCLKKKKLHD